MFEKEILVTPATKHPTKLYNALQRWQRISHSVHRSTKLKKIQTKRQIKSNTSKIETLIQELKNLYKQFEKF